MSDRRSPDPGISGNPAESHRAGTGPSPDNSAEAGEVAHSVEDRLAALAQQVQTMQDELDKTRAKLDNVEHRLLLSQKLSEIQRNALRLSSPYSVHCRIALLTLFEYSLDEDEMVRYECVNALARIPELPAFELSLRPIILHLRGMARHDKSPEVSLAARRLLLKFGVDLDARKSGDPGDDNDVDARRPGINRDRLR
jgi:hypothetical protein